MHQHGEVPGGARPRMRVPDRLAGTFQPRLELRIRIDRQAFAATQQRGGKVHHPDRDEVVGRVEAQLVIDRGRDGETGLMDEQCVAVRCGAGHPRHADGSAGAGDRLDDDRLA